MTVRILRMRIGSFGTLKDKDYALDPGLNVVYGPNEAGKSTLRSFVTNTLFSKTDVRYPETRRSDNGRMEIEMSDGTVRTVERDGKKSIGYVDAECGISGKEYTSIYSMQPEDLRDTGNLEKGEIRNRFLTIPGGKDLPKVYRDLLEERTAYVPDGRRSEKARMSVLTRELEEAGRRVAELQNGSDDGYNGLVMRREELRNRKAEVETRGKELTETVRKAALADARKQTRDKIGELRQRESSLKHAERYSPESREVRAGLEKTYTTASEELETAEERYRTCEAEMGGADADAVIRNREAIERLHSAPAHRRDAVESRPAPKNGIAAAVGAAIMVAGIAMFVMDIAMGAAAAAAGAVIMTVFLLRKGPSAAAARPAADADMAKLLDRIAAETHIVRSGTETDVKVLYGLIGKATRLRDCGDALRMATGKKNDAYDKLQYFYSGFGGKEGFETAMREREELDMVRAKLSALDDGAQAPEEPDGPSPEKAAADQNEAVNDLGEISRELGEVEQAIRDIEKGRSVEDAITERSEAENRAYSGALEWASLMMQQIILDEASRRMYTENRSDVLVNADRYLSLMTDGRYGMCSDPSSDDLAVRDLATGEVKNSKQWSTGLEDQVKLSLKMAVSLSLCEEKPPMILDDVLLTSDSGRKAGACRAIADLSRDIQVIYFTCDRETRDLLEDAGGRIVDI